MQNVLLVAYLLIVLALIAVILLQRSEGGGLGMGGNAGGLMTVRGSANLLTRTTAILAALFFATAIGLTILSSLNRGTDSILDQAAAPNGAAPSNVLDALTQMQAGASSAAASTASSATTDPGLALPATPVSPGALAVPATNAADASSAAPVSSAAADASSAAPVSSAAMASSAEPASSVAPPSSSSPAPSSAAPAPSSAPAQ
ncbi:MAG TPA: preprotein translocase subunit SecG [Devosia sp.]|nr:preprotein translocase subunit SecG [Devosia sp.]